ncbi:hypothetical protein D3C81_2326700 [compost metagenome]
MRSAFFSSLLEASANVAMVDRDRPEWRNCRSMTPSSPDIWISKSNDEPSAGFSFRLTA